MNRYSINFKDSSVEPDEVGKWVKYSEFAQLENLVDVRAEEIAQQRHASVQIDLNGKNETVRTLTAELERAQTELADVIQARDAAYTRHANLMKEARDRLNLHGHSASCGSRYTATTIDGNSANKGCDCGLEAWMRESGIKNG